MEQYIESFKKLKEEHELPNDNSFEYNLGYVKAMNKAINTLKKLVKEPVSERQNATVTIVFDLDRIRNVECKTPCNSKYKTKKGAYVGSIACQECKYLETYDTHNYVVECSAPDKVEAAKT